MDPMKQCENCGSFVCAGCRGMNVPLDDERRRQDQVDAAMYAGEGFVKHDANKLRMDLLQPKALEAIAAVLTHGAKKYSDNNWRKGSAWSRYYGALLRHLNAWWAGERKDPDSGLDHLAHAACCLMFLQSYEIEGLGTDDRPCCCGAPNDKQATHSPDACVGPTSGVGKVQFPKIGLGSPYSASPSDTRKLIDRFCPPPPPGAKRPMTATEIQYRCEHALRYSAGSHFAVDWGTDMHKVQLPTVELFPYAEGQIALQANIRLIPDYGTEMLFGAYRYQSPTGRIAYIVCARLKGQARMAVGSAVLQPGDVEDRKIGLQIAVGQALKNHARGRFYHPRRIMDALILAPGGGLTTKVRAERVFPVAQDEIRRADERKRKDAIPRFDFDRWIEILRKAGCYNAPPRLR